MPLALAHDASDVAHLVDLLCAEGMLECHCKGRCDHGVAGVAEQVSKQRVLVEVFQHMISSTMRVSHHQIWCSRCKCTPREMHDSLGALFGGENPHIITL